VTISYPSLKGR